MREQILLIYNPKAGKGMFLNHLSTVIDLFVKAGFRIEVYPTQANGDAVKKLSTVEEKEFSMIVTAGGDGTLDEVVTGMLNHGLDIPIGYIPVGSTNDYATSLGLSSNVVQAVGDILDGIPKKVDAGRLNDQHVFIYVAAFGAFTDVAYETNQDMKNILGHVAYLIEATKRITDLKPYHLKVHSDSLTREGDYLFGMVTNSISVGGFRNITGKGVELDDGVFEVTLIRRPTNLIELNEIVTSLLTQNYKTQMIDYFKTDRIELSCEEEMPWTLDGEFGGAYKETTIVNERQRIRIFTDPSKIRSVLVPIE